MNYRCPKCKHRLDIRSLFFRDITACAACGQKVVLGDFLAFAMAAVAMLVSALSALLILGAELAEYYVAAGYSVAIGMAAGLLVLLVLGRASPLRSRRKGRRLPGGGAVPPEAT